MTDNPNWHSPAGWTPPPKPGLIPLRPLSFGTILGSSFRVMRRNPAPTFGLSVLLYGFITIIYLAVVGGIVALGFSRVGSATGSDADAILVGSIGLVGLSALVPIGLAVIAAGILQGIIALEVSRATLGEKLRVRGLWRLAKGRKRSLIGFTSALTGVVIVFVLIGSAVTIAVFGAIGQGFGNSQDAVVAILVSIGVAFVIGAIFVVVGAFFGTKLALVPSIIMLERLPMVPAIRRSWQLTKRNFWRTLGTQLLISVIVSTASSVVTTPISLLGGIVGAFVNPNGDELASGATLVVLYLVLGIVTIVVGAVGLVMQSSAYSLIYIDIRMRKEGLDLELLRYVEAKQSGTPGVENPYLVTPGQRPETAPPTGSPWS